MAASGSKVLLGIDTGGTYTDAVLFTHEDGVLAKAKSLTTKHDLSIGISGAVNAVLEARRDLASQVKLVSLSTTLATNALVEGKGGSIGLVMIGFDEADMEKAGLKEALGGDPVVFIPGGHDVQGNERRLDMSDLETFVEQQSPNVSGFAVAGYFAVRNASHELKVKEYLIEKSGLPVTCSHELSSKLGGPKRALTTLLNGRLIPVIHDLIVACRNHLQTVDIKAPVMVVRGDGALVDSDFALNRPIETILSGPAASLVGAKFLLGRKDAVISDIGGTTTDVAILEKGWPRIEPNGASVGGFTTMVEAVAMHTFGLGGDSTVTIDDDSKTKVTLGPRRQIPISLLAIDYPDLVREELKRQIALDNPPRTCGRFAFRAPGMESRAGALKTTEAKLFARLTGTPQPLDTFLKGSSEAGTLNKLVSRGMAHVSGLTPSDAMHVLGLQDNWDGETAQLAASIYARMKDRFGRIIATTAEELSENIKNQLTNQSCDVILKTCSSEDGVDIGPGASALIARALAKTSGFVKFNVSLDRPLVGLGASASTYYPAIGKRLDTECLVPEDADVANAIGAVASEVRVSKSIQLSSSDGGGSITVLMPTGPKVFANEELAIETARSTLQEVVLGLAEEAGAEEPELETTIEVDAPMIEGSRHFVQAVVTISATGRPKQLI